MPIHDTVMCKELYEYTIYRSWMCSGKDNQDKIMQMQIICVTREH